MGWFSVAVEPRTKAAILISCVATSCAAGESDTQLLRCGSKFG